MAIGADLLYHVDEVVVALLEGGIEAVEATLGLIFAKAGHVEV